MSILWYCPNCGVVYFGEHPTCVTPACQPTDEWIPPQLEALKEYDLPIDEGGD